MIEEEGTEHVTNSQGFHKIRDSPVICSRERTALFKYRGLCPMNALTILLFGGLLLNVCCREPRFITSPMFDFYDISKNLTYNEIKPVVKKEFQIRFDDECSTITLAQNGVGYYQLIYQCGDCREEDPSLKDRWGVMNLNQSYPVVPSAVNCRKSFPWRLFAALASLVAATLVLLILANLVIKQNLKRFKSAFKVLASEPNDLGCTLVGDFKNEMILPEEASE